MRVVINFFTKKYKVPYSKLNEHYTKSLNLDVHRKLCLNNTKNSFQKKWCKENKSSFLFPEDSLKILIKSSRSSSSPYIISVDSAIGQNFGLGNVILLVNAL